MRHLRHLGYVTMLLTLLLLAAGPKQSWGQQGERIGTVAAVDGTAEVRAANTTTWEPLQFRAVLFPMDTVRTRPASKVKVLLRDDSIMTLAENSEMEFTEFLLTPQQRRTTVSLLTGTLRVVTTKIFGAGSGTEVRTANTVAGVRGTTFVVIFIPPSTTQVLSLEGVVSVRNLNPAIPQIEPLQQNFRTVVVGNAPPSRATVLSAAERQAIERELRLTEQVPVEVQPTDAGPSGTIRGASEEDKQIERSGTPSASGLPLRTDALLGLQNPQDRLDQLLDRTRSVQAAQAPEPPNLAGGAGIITPDSPAAQTTLLNTQAPNLRLTITIPRN